MSTRAILNLTDGLGDRIRLYCPSDGYIRNGLGEWLYEFCERYKGNGTVSSVLNELLLSQNCIGLSLTGEMDAIDYVYGIECTKCAKLLLTCSRVDWTGGIKGRSLSSIDIVAELEKPCNDVWPGLSSCPFCGRKPATVASFRDGNTVCCDDSSCK